jgi:hypothetical protein
MIILPKSGGMSNARHMYVRNRGHSDPDGVCSCSRVPTVSLSSTYAQLLCCHGTGWTAREQLLATGAPNPNAGLFSSFLFFSPFLLLLFFISQDPNDTSERHFGAQGATLKTSNLCRAHFCSHQPLLSGTHPEDPQKSPVQVLWYRCG